MNRFGVTGRRLGTTTPGPVDQTPQLPPQVVQAIEGGPETAAVLIGYPTLDALLEDVPEELHPWTVKALGQKGALISALVRIKTHDKLGAEVPPSPRSRLARIVDSAAAAKRADEMRTRLKAQQDKMTTCRILGQPDHTTRFRVVEGKEIRLSDRGHLAVLAVQLEEVTAEQKAAARALLGRPPTPDTPDPQPETTKRRRLLG